MNYLKSLGLSLVLGCLFMNPLSAQEGESYFNHTISQGETLYSIAAMYNVSKEDIIRLNPSCVSVIRKGEVLRIPQKTTSSLRYYTIKKGDTLYGVARKYNMTVDKLMVANPGVTAQTFTEGKVIRISGTAAPPTATAPVRPSQSLSGNCREIHKAKRKDTPEKVAEKYHISLQALMDANPEMKKVGYKMQKGDLLCIPYTDNKTTAQTTYAATAPSPLPLLKVGVVLPFKSDNKMEQDRMVEYYRGILMAVDSLKTLGRNVEVYAYNSGKTPADMQSVLANANLQKCNLIFGPYYADQLPVLAEFSNRMNCTVVAPFSGLNDKIYSCKNLYLVNPPKNYQYGNVFDGFVKMFRGQNVILYSTPGTTTEATDFIIGLKQALRNAGMQFQVMPEHATEQQMLKMVDLQKANVIVPTSYGIAALNTLTAKFKAFMGQHPSYQFQLFGYPDWQAFQKYHLKNYYFMDTFIYTSFYNVSWRKKNLKFVADYERNFNTEMLNTHPKYPMLGFDTGFYFMSGMVTYGKTFPYNINKIKTEPYQNDFSFKRVNNWGGFVNEEVKFIHYTRKQTTEILDFTK